MKPISTTHVRQGYVIGLALNAIILICKRNKADPAVLTFLRILILRYLHLCCLHGLIGLDAIALCLVLIHGLVGIY